MLAENRQYQNCNNLFEIEPEDFLFYERIRVPAPTWCPECRMRRRMMFRNERALYRRKCDVTGKDIISMYSPDKPLTVYNRDYWWSDGWDPLEYGMEYDFSKPFFEQFKALIKKIPWPSLFNWNSVNSDYCNHTTDNKNCYLVFGGDFNENCAYSKFNIHCRDSFDLFWVDKCELSYEAVDSGNCYKVFFSQYTYNSQESAFLFNCVNCNNCLGCVNIRNKSYHIFNEPYSKSEYERKLEKFNLGDFSSLVKFRSKFFEFEKKFPHRYAEIIKSVNSTGNNIYNSKNCDHCFDVHDNTEDSKHLLIAGWGVKDAYYSDHVGYNAELIYDSIGAFSGVKRVLFSLFMPTCQDVTYSYNCKSSSGLFGCVGLRNKSYSILNKQYSREEYENLVPRIIDHMNSMPYVDKAGRVYRYGEFFPPDLSPFSYNETIAQEYFPLTKEQALAQGYRWKDQEARQYAITMTSDRIPDHIKDAPDSITGEVIQCGHANLSTSDVDRLATGCNEQCTTAFKVIEPELQFYRRMGLSLPRLCPNCRHYQRLKQRNPIKLWYRTCECAGKKSKNSIYTNTIPHFHRDNSCLNEFETSYDSKRSEIVYCEQCYNAEVA